MYPFISVVYMYAFALISAVVVVVVHDILVIFVVVEQEEEEEEGRGMSEGGDDVVLHPRGAVEKTEEDEEAEDEFEALLSKTMSESVERTKIARATTQVGCCSFAVSPAPLSSSLRRVLQRLAALLWCYWL